MSMRDILVVVVVSVLLIIAMRVYNSAITGRSAFLGITSFVIFYFIL